MSSQPDGPESLNDLPVPPPVPLPNSYWAVEHELLAGEYPGAYPGRSGAGTARERLTALLDAGVRVFVDLTEVGESGLDPYDDLLMRLAEERDPSVRYVRLPIRDQSIPRERAEMVEILDELDRARDAGTLAYVHCWGGTGRTGTVIGCLYRRRGASGEDALEEVFRRWSDMAKAPHRPWGSPENEKQRRYVREWSEAITASSDRGDE